ncbi:hypothetical protein JOB18_022193 [Solea senegalensis]|uniref:Rhodanese domain-containing protein n=1 Tax=Solea senegalensis TaxID=28829 RepID=A0AAV6PR44_SOLSE|nr:thiosulfate sulfurtransferase/rhodanese-like domain-containing protein 3 [Solea senegalensis]XP_043891010.1 thiosulfate sulfurtransferase/rhodanese-like domain-containing protein 3 [Solea senegalensis]KAG7475031.1 hypothetical protein JOB18_022193 [Solea senegalensis]KAG7475033.1 hypothetical protein JOB18_022193 [Solea senegalensis]
MALRRCWRFSGLVPRLLWHGTVQSVASFPVGRGSVSSVGRKTTELLLCSRFTSATPSNIVTYKQLRQLLTAQNAVVIDVREPWELRDFGSIPGTVNVPLAQVNTALQLSPAEFKEKYGGEMPERTDTVVFTCLAGIRSKNALIAAVSLGYTDVQDYSGGWKDWEKNEKEM